MVISAEVNTSSDDRSWDNFLEASLHGQFQQSSFWAAAKIHEGWSPARLLLRADGCIIGGVQVLWKKTRFGPLGFANKGPVVQAGAPEVLREACRRLAELQAQQGWRALIVQGPDFESSVTTELKGVGFFESRMLHVIDSTLLIDLAGGWAAVQSHFRKTIQRQSRQAPQRGVVFTEGQETDIDYFFRLMEETCRRHGVEPKPSSPSALAAIWRAFDLHGRVRLFFVAKGEHRIAGALCLAFGDRVTEWKKGWDGSHSECFPNALLTAEAMRWAIQRGARWFDFVSLDRDIAEAMVQGRTLPVDLARRRDFFHLGFGGQALLLPPPLIRFNNPGLGWLYRLATNGPFSRGFEKALRRFSDVS